MIQKRKIVIYWLLLLIPTIVIVSVAFQLISHEQERIIQSEITSLADRATAIAESIHIAISDVESELTESMFEIPDNNLEETLILWAETNPLVRNVFIWNKEKMTRLKYPYGGLESTNEERQFIKRYDALFSERVPWRADSETSSAEFADNGSSELSKNKETNRFLNKISDLKSERRKLVDLAKVQNIPATSMAQSESDIPDANEKKLFKKQSGWIPWFAENRLFLLGWVKKNNNGPIYGVELELVTILSRLVTELPDINSTRSAYALINENGQILHQSGPFQIDIKNKPEINISISDLLPHWKICIFLHEKGLHTNNGFIYISGLLLAIFVAAIFAGGALLTSQAQQNLKDAIEKTSFVSSVSHELKTPLTSIRMYAELLQTGRIKQPEKISRYLSVIVTESQRLTRLVNNVLDFGRLEEGKKKYNPGDFDLSNLLHEIINTNKLRIEKSGIKPEILIPDTKMPVYIDRDAIEQVVLNLVDNAIKYAENGGRLILSADSSDPLFYEIKIQDFGPGIPSEQKEKIFEKFHRVDNSLTSEQPGSGLGLSIARRIMRDMNGDLVFNPGKTCGCCFTIKIRKNI